MRYKVIYSFADLQDRKYKYETGDIFPRQGLNVSEDRIKELTGSDNKLRRPLIEKISEKTKEVSEEVHKEPKKKTAKRKNKNAD